MISGSFLEKATHLHVSLRREMMRWGALPQPPFEPRPVDSLFSDGAARPEIALQLAASGVAMLALREPPSDRDFISFGRTLGDLLVEGDPSVQERVTERVLLNLEARMDATDDPLLQPFSASYLTLHTENSRRALGDQPRLIILLCVEPGHAESAGQTVIVPMAGLVDRLSPQSAEVLRHTFYEGDRDGAATILRSEAHGPVLNFRDFRADGLSWVHTSKSRTDQVNQALAELLVTMYSSRGAYAVRWSRGLLVIIDNWRVMHGRSTCTFSGRPPHRHLKRLRVRV